MALPRLWNCAPVVFTLLVASHTEGCRLPESWSGRWFQLGAGKPLIVNSTYVESKGKCLKHDQGKYMFYDRSDNCYRCLGMYEKHRNVLQYKESYCDPGNSFEKVCDEINIDAPLVSMFRLDATPVSCPFHAPPFAVVYNRGHGDCASPPSRADACTVDTRLVLRYQACADITGSEAAVEELECLATWRESSSRYLLGRLHHKMATTDEQRYRCFIYEKEPRGYLLAQSGDASCSGINSPIEGSTNIKLTRLDNPQTTCKFPSWVTQHYHWHSLDYRHNYHFSHKNATLRVSSVSGDVEAKLSCHSIVSDSHNVAKLVVHVISGCDGGYKCMTFHKRDPHVLQMYQSGMSQEPFEACNSAYDDYRTPTESITLTTASLPTKKCPMDGKYAPPATRTLIPSTEECTHHTNLQSLYVGCSPSKDTMEFQSTCRTVPTTAYSCHGSWSEKNTTYIIGSPVNRHSTDARHYCFIFTESGSNFVLKRVAETCTLSTWPVEWSFNITQTGKCSESSGSAHPPALFNGLFLVTILHCLTSFLTR